MAAESKTQNMMEAKKGLFFEKYYYGLLLRHLVICTKLNSYTKNLQNMQ